MNKTRDKLSFFYSETSQFLYLVAFLVACARLSNSREVAKIKQAKRKKDARSPPFLLESHIHPRLPVNAYSKTKNGQALFIEKILQVTLEVLTTNA